MDAQFRQLLPDFQHTIQKHFQNNDADQVSRLIKDFDTRYSNQLQDQQLAIEELTQMFNINKLRVDVETGVHKTIEALGKRIKQENTLYIQKMLSKEFLTERPRNDPAQPKLTEY